MDATIIVTPFKKWAYLVGAIKTALSQDYDRNRYEIILVKNFSDKDIEEFSSFSLIKVINSTEGNLMATIIQGARESKGDVIVLLEDDDELTPQ